MNDFYYRTLNVYHNSLELVANIYRLSRGFPEDEKFGLSNQIHEQELFISETTRMLVGLRKNFEDKIV